MTSRQYRDRRTRRAFLGVLATGSALAVAGCSGDGGTTTAEGGATQNDGGEGSPTAGGDGATPTTGGGSPGGEGPLSSPVAGSPDADVTLAVFEDYACPHCARYNVETFPSIRADYLDPGRIRYEHHDFPLPVANPGSYQAANAARAVQARAGDDAFYDYAHRLFRNSERIPSEGPTLYESLAEQQGLDGSAIRRAAVDRAYRQTVQEDFQRGRTLGVSSTPTFVLNGRIAVAGNQPTKLRAALDEALGGGATA